MNKAKQIILLLGVSLWLDGCYYDKFAELHPLDGYVNTCDDTLSKTYNGSVNLVIKSNCISCHSAKRADGNIVLESYSQLKSEGQRGRLLGVIEHQGGYQAMPPGTKIRDCEIAVIQAWVSAGMPE